MWSFGCVIYWVLTRTIPFSRNDPTVLNNFIRDESFFPSQRLRDRGVSNEAIGFLRQLIVVQPSARTSSAMALGHPWLGHVDTAGTPTRTKRHANVRYVPLSNWRSHCSNYFAKVGRYFDCRYGRYRSWQIKLHIPLHFRATRHWQFSRVKYVIHSHLQIISVCQRGDHALIRRQEQDMWRFINANTEAKRFIWWIRPVLTTRIDPIPMYCEK
jgi:serine/threonine protein kinase